MLETAIVGGGLCGLALARGLQMQGHDFALFEARSRLGGRILTVQSAAADMTLDLGPSWFWPQTQPRISQLVGELGLASFPQHDTGKVLNLSDHDKPPDVLEKPEWHGGAHRIAGGMGALVQALSQEFRPETVRLGYVLTGVLDQGEHVALRFACGEETVEVAARRVVLALPPRLLEERVQFRPPLNGQIQEAMRETYTWMADQAKVMVGYARPFWRTEGHAGNALVHHAHVVLNEIFDACDATGDRAALGGFFALPGELRDSLRLGLSMLVSSQLAQVFGPDAEHGEQHIQDWAKEPYTASTRDLTGPEQHPEYGHPCLRLPQWNGKLHFGGSETASYGGGYLEGALEAAARLQRALIQTAAIGAHSEAGADARPNAFSLARFRSWVDTQRSEAFERYQRQLKQNLASQVKDQITQRAVLGAMEQIYSEALAVLGELPFDGVAAGFAGGRSELTREVLASFIGFNKALLDQVLVFNRGSCALSNFPGEHAVSPEYLETIARDLAAAWQEFAVNVNTLLLGKAQAGVHVATAA